MTAADWLAFIVEVVALVALAKWLGAALRMIHDRAREPGALPPVDGTNGR